VKKENLPAIYFLPKLRTEDELSALLCYNNYLMQQIDEMKLHPLHKEDVKSVLMQAIAQLQTITQLKDDRRNEDLNPQMQNWLFRFLQKINR
jgi:hypothetical protein